MPWRGKHPCHKPTRAIEQPNLILRRFNKEDAQCEHRQVMQLSPGIRSVGAAAFRVLGPGSRSVCVPPGEVAWEVAPVPGARARGASCAEERLPVLWWGAVVCVSPSSPGCLPLPGLGWPGRSPGVHNNLSTFLLSQVPNGFSDLEGVSHSALGQWFFTLSQSLPTP